MNDNLINVNSYREYNYELIYSWQSLLAQNSSLSYHLFAM